jgi:predicted MFS family arabinose efflux permease
MRFNNITKIIIVNFCQRFHLYIHAYALLLQSRGLSLLQISIIESLVIGTVFVMEVPTGVIADRIGRKWSIVASTFCLLCGESIFLFARSYSWYLLIALFTGTGFAFASGAVDALVYDSLPEANRDNEMKRVMGLVGSAGQIAFFIAPIIGAIIIGDATPERFILAIILTVVALCIGLLVSLTLQEPPTAWSAAKPNALTIFRAGVNELRSNRQLQQLVLLIMLTSTFTGTLVTTLAAPHLIQQGAAPYLTGIALSVGSLIAAFAQRNAYKVEARLGQKWGLTLLILLPGVLYWLLAVVAGTLPALLIIILMYGTNDMKAPLFSAYQNALIGSRNRATVLSITSMFVNIFIAVVAPIYATIAGYSLPVAFAAIGSVIIAAGLVLRVYRAPTHEAA